MISIIICSKDPRQLTSVKQNIHETIGVSYEMIVIDNSLNQQGIGEVYNNGGRLAKYEYLCFIHEDIEFSNVGWGKNIIRYLDDEELGLVGVAGSGYKSRISSGWGGIRQFDYCNIYQEEKNSVFSHLYSNPRNEHISMAVVVDGVFLATKKYIWEEIRFDQQTFRGFHCYDLDFSLRVLEKYKVAVVYDIVIRHFSCGNFSEEWLKWSFILQKKFSKKLPVIVPDGQRISRAVADFRIFKYWGRRILGNRSIGVFYELRWLLNSLFVIFGDLFLSGKIDSLK